MALHLVPKIRLSPLQMGLQNNFQDADRLESGKHSELG